MSDAENKFQIITIRFINQPKGRGVSWSIRDTEGEFWGLPKKLVDTVKEGETIEVGYTERTVNNMTFRDIKAIYAAPQPQPQPEGQAAPAQATGAPYDQTRDRNIYLTGTLQQALAAGLPIDQVVPLTVQLALGWDVFHGDYRSHAHAQPAAQATQHQAADDPFTATARQPARGSSAANGTAATGHAANGHHNGHALRGAPAGYR